LPYPTLTLTGPRLQALQVEAAVLQLGQQLRRQRVLELPQRVLVRPQAALERLRAAPRALFGAVCARACRRAGLLGPARR